MNTLHKNKHVFEPESPESPQNPDAQPILTVFPFKVTYPRLLIPAHSNCNLEFAFGLPEKSLFHFDSWQDETFTNRGRLKTLLSFKHRWAISVVLLQINHLKSGNNPIRDWHYFYEAGRHIGCQVTKFLEPAVLLKSSVQWFRPMVSPIVIRLENDF